MMHGDQSQPVDQLRNSDRKIKCSCTGCGVFNLRWPENTIFFEGEIFLEKLYLDWVELKDGICAFFSFSYSYTHVL